MVIFYGFKSKIFGPNKFARYEVEIQTINNEIEKGYLLTEEIADTFENNKFQNWILSNNGDYTRGNKIWLCKDQYFFKHPDSNSQYFSCCREAIKIQKEKILKIEKLKIVKDVNQSIQKQITDKEKELFQTEPVSKLKFYLEGEVIHDPGGDYFVDYWLLSFNQKIGKDKLIEIRNQIMDDFLKSKKGAKRNEVYDNWAKIYSKNTEELLNKSIIFLEIGGM